MFGFFNIFIWHRQLTAIRNKYRNSRKQLACLKSIKKSYSECWGNYKSKKIWLSSECQQNLLPYICVFFSREDHHITYQSIWMQPNSISNTNWQRCSNDLSELQFHRERSLKSGACVLRQSFPARRFLQFFKLVKLRIFITKKRLSSIKNENIPG